MLILVINCGSSSVKYDLFTFKDARIALTGWGFVALVGAIIVFKNKIKEALKEADNNLGETYKRAKLAITMTILSLIVVSVNFFVEAFVVLFMIIAGSTLISLPIYKPYDEVLVLKRNLQEELKKRNTQDALESMESVLNT